MKIFILIIICVLLGINTLLGQSKYEVPPKQFTGTWIVEKAIYNPPEGASPEAIKEKIPNQEYLFKKGKKQALYRYFSDSKKSEYGITILEVSKTKLVFRSWSAHPDKKTVITLKNDGTAIVEEIYAKGGRVFHVTRPEKTEPGEKRPDAEQVKD